MASKSTNEKVGHVVLCSIAYILVKGILLRRKSSLEGKLARLHQKGEIDLSVTSAEELLALPIPLLTNYLTGEDLQNAEPKELETAGNSEQGATAGGQEHLKFSEAISIKAVVSELKQFAELKKERTELLTEALKEFLASRPQSSQATKPDMDAVRTLNPLYFTQFVENRVPRGTTVADIVRQYETLLDEAAARANRTNELRNSLQQAGLSELASHPLCQMYIMRTFPEALVQARMLLQPAHPALFKTDGTLRCKTYPPKNAAEVVAALRDEKDKMVTDALRKQQLDKALEAAGSSMGVSGTWTRAQPMSMLY